MAGEHSHLTKLKQGSTTIARVTSLAGPTLEKQVIDVTDLESVNRAVEKILSLRDFGEVTAEINFDPDGATHRLLTDSYLADTFESWSVEFPDGTVWGPFQASVTGFEPGAEVGSQLTASLTLTLTGHTDLPS